MRNPVVLVSLTPTHSTILAQEMQRTGLSAQDVIRNLIANLLPTIACEWTDAE
jgi:hypothetical protein